MRDTSGIRLKEAEVLLGEDPQIVLDCRHNLGESCVWDDRRGVLHWVNIHEGEVWSWSPDQSESPRVKKFEERVGAIALREAGGLALALASGFALLEDGSSEPVRLANVENELETTRLNDGRADPAGRFVCGGMDEANPQQPISAVYALEADQSVRMVLGKIHCANSTCWSPDGRTMYFTDMPSRKIEAFDYDIATGTVCNRRLFADLGNEAGLADGSTVDAEGYLWNAQWGGGKIVRYSPQGAVDREIFLPVENPTCLTFGGAELDILFVTTAWFGLDEERRRKQPHAGSLFALRPGVRGFRENRYGG